METFKSVEEIIEYYERYLYDQNTRYEYVTHNLRYYSRFITRIEQLEKILDELNDKAKRPNTKITIEVKKKIEDFTEEYNELKKEVKESFEYYNNLLWKLLVDFNKNCDKKDAEITYNSICKSIIQSRLNFHIKIEKKLIIFIEKLKEFSFFN